MGACRHGVVRQQKATVGKNPLTVEYHAPAARGADGGVADYAQTLLEALRSAAPPGAVIEPGASRADVHLYHLGNNRLHAEIYARALATPGVAVIHDAVFHHFLLGALPEARYLEEFVYRYGEWSRHSGEELWRGAGRLRGRSRRYFRYPMLRRSVENARAVVVH